MKIVKKIFLYLIAVLLTSNNAMAQEQTIMYGVGEWEMDQQPETLLDKILSIVLTPVSYIVITVFVITTGILIFIKKKKNVKKDN